MLPHSPLSIDRSADDVSHHNVFSSVFRSFAESPLISPIHDEEPVRDVVCFEICCQRHIATVSHMGLISDRIGQSQCVPNIGPTGSSFDFKFPSMYVITAAKNTRSRFLIRNPFSDGNGWVNGKPKFEKKINYYLFSLALRANKYSSLNFIYFVIIQTNKKQQVLVVTLLSQPSSRNTLSAGGTGGTGEHWL